MTGASGFACGTLLGGALLNTPEYGGDWVWGLGFPGMCAAFCCLQMLLILLLSCNTYEPPLPALPSSTRAAAALASMRQTAEALRSCFLVNVLAFHFLAELTSSVVPPSEMPVLLYWCALSHVMLCYALTCTCRACHMLRATA